MNVRETTRSDLDDVARIHTAAFAGEIGPTVGLRYVRSFLQWFVDAPDCVSLVVEHDGRIIGYTFGAPGGYNPQLTRDLLPVIAMGVFRNLGRVARHPSFRRQIRSRVANILLRREPRSAIADATPAGIYCLVGIGTAADARGKGAGKALVAALCERSGGRSVILDVFKDNAPARALYERCGFEVLVEEGRVVRMIRPSAG